VYVLMMTVPMLLLTRRVLIRSKSKRRLFATRMPVSPLYKLKLYNIRMRLMLYAKTSPILTGNFATTNRILRRPLRTIPAML
jgi:hypothetical protein